MKHFEIIVYLEINQIWVCPGRGWCPVNLENGMVKSDYYLSSGGRSWNR
jgi:hypothetical protein